MIPFDGLNMNPSTLPLLSQAQSRSISAENFTGEKNGGGLATEGTGAACARELGRGWKVSPSISIPAKDTATLAQIDGPGAIQSMWITGSVTRDMILRIYCCLLYTSRCV